MEELTKSQIVLLTLLVSFVTSIATGIVTVSLMDQAPPAITQSVSRVIQKTVQTVAPPSGSHHAAATITQEKTVIVNESDLISKAVERMSPSVVRLFGGTADDPVFLGLGVILDASGMVATDKRALGDSSGAQVVLQDGSSVRSVVKERDSSSELAYLTPATTTIPAPRWVPAVVSTGKVVLGQSVVALSGVSSPRIASGLVTGLVPSGGASSSPRIIETDIPSGSILPGSPIINTEGALVGLSTGASRDTTASSFLSTSVLMALLLK